MGSYKEEITRANAELAKNPRTIFIGYGLTHGRAMGTLRDVPAAQILETPVAENLMVGLAIGLSLRGRLPVVFVERCDFLLNALDAVVNHLDKIKQLSRDQFQPAVILRVIVGNQAAPLFTGPVHTQDFSGALRHMVGFPVWNLREADRVASFYGYAQRDHARGLSTALFEYKDHY